MASTNKVWRKMLGVESIVVEGFDIDDAEGSLVVAVRPMKRGRRRCPYCRARCSLYDRGHGRRRWRGLDLGTTKVFLEAEAPRVHCSEHGVVVAEVPWARPDSGFTRDFEQQCAWLAVQTSRTAVAHLMRVAWRSVGRMLTRVADERLEGQDLLDGLTRIGIDELSYRKGHKYVTVVIDHDSGRLVWMAPGRDRATVHAFFDALGEERCRQLKLVSADAAAWINGVVAERAPQAERCMDPFHVVQWATDALDQVRRSVWNDLRKHGDAEQAPPLKAARWALWKNPEDLNATQRTTLSWVAHLNEPLYRAYLLKEGLRTVFHQKSYRKAKARLDEWLRWACRCRIEPIVKLSRAVRRHRTAIESALRHRLSNAVVEGKNTQLRLLHRIAHGFHDVQAFISLAMLKLGGLCPPLPGRG